MADLTDEEFRVIVWTMLGEGAGESDEGLRAIAWTIRNRSHSSRFPSNPASVALSKNNSTGKYAFSTWNKTSQGGNQPKRHFPVESEQFQRALGIAEAVFGNELSDNTNGALFYITEAMYQNPAAHPSWWNEEVAHGVLKIEGHRFPQPYSAGMAPDRIAEAKALEASLALASVFDPLRAGEDDNTPTPYAPLARARIVEAQITTIHASSDLQTALDKLAATRRLQLGEQAEPSSGISNGSIGISRANSVTQGGAFSTGFHRNESKAEDEFRASTGLMFAPPALTQEQIASQIRTVQTVKVNADGSINIPEQVADGDNPLGLPIPQPGTSIPDPTGPGLVAKDTSRLTSEETALADIGSLGAFGNDNSLGQGITPASTEQDLSEELPQIAVDEFGIVDSTPDVLPADLAANLELNTVPLAPTGIPVMPTQATPIAVKPPTANPFRSADFKHNPKFDERFHSGQDMAVYRANKAALGGKLITQQNLDNAL